MRLHVSSVGFFRKTNFVDHIQTGGEKSLGIYKLFMLFVQMPLTEFERGRIIILDISSFDRTFWGLCRMIKWPGDMTETIADHRGRVRDAISFRERHARWLPWGGTENIEYLSCFSSMLLHLEDYDGTRNFMQKMHEDTYHLYLTISGLGLSSLFSESFTPITRGVLVDQRFEEVVHSTMEYAGCLYRVYEHSQPTQAQEQIVEALKKNIALCSTTRALLSGASSPAMIPTPARSWAMMDAIPSGPSASPSRISTWITACSC